MKATAAVAAALGCLAWGCAGPPAVPGGAPPPNAEIYQRATNHFALADFFKPTESKTNEPAFTLAPLILQEVTGATAQATPPDRFGTLSLSNGLWGLDLSRSSVYWRADTVTHDGKTHAQLAYWWFYGVGTARSESTPCLAAPDRGAGGLTVQGVRLTLNSAGQPVIWEVLADRSRTELIFVAQSLEAAAAARFGKPLPGRRYSVERSVAEAPQVIVARVIDDGPTAMGPILYLSAGTREVSTLICRCMPAQARTLRATVSYDLPPLPSISGDVDSLPRGLGPGDAPSGKRLEDRLRLPGF